MDNTDTEVGKARFLLEEDTPDRHELFNVACYCPDKELRDKAWDKFIKCEFKTGPTDLLYNLPFVIIRAPDKWAEKAWEQLEKMDPHIEECLDPIMRFAPSKWANRAWKYVVNRALKKGEDRDKFKIIGNLSSKHKKRQEEAWAVLQKLKLDMHKIVLILMCGYKKYADKAFEYFVASKPKKNRLRKIIKQINEMLSRYKYESYRDKKDKLAARKERRVLRTFKQKTQAILDKLKSA